MEVINSAKKAWKGEEQLWIVFCAWFLGVNVVWWLINITGVLNNLVEKMVFTPPNNLGNNILFSVDILAIVVIRTFQMVSLWRCSFNSNKRILGYFVRFIVLVMSMKITYGIIDSILYVISKN